MEITTTIGSILNRKGFHVWSVSPSDTVFEAISMMAEKMSAPCRSWRLTVSWA